jgi:hypothetical protein
VSDLSPEELALLESVRREWGPTDAAEPPSPAAIRERLAEKPWLGEPSPRTGPHRVGRAALMTIAAASVFSLGIVVLRASSSSRPIAAPVTAPVLMAEPQRDPAPAVANEAPSISIHALPDAPPTPNVALPPRKEASGREAVAPSRMPGSMDDDDTLAEELKLVRAAQGALRDGAPDRALIALASHASRFPRGVLRDERMTLQALAFCARGDVAAARDMKGELERVSPGSSHLQRLASSCAR